ncbi:hypothetical protein PG985_003632 [Apiospora marii]|uniref:uncharacterized protein n=1 Tax=Apiospora marii TaxID=335849 RepID=UPI003130E32F
MDSNQQFSQPARSSSPDSASSQDTPQWEHVEDVSTHIEKNEKRTSFFSEYYSFPPVGLTEDEAELCMLEWLHLAPENACLVSLQTRQLIKSVDSMETALSTISYLSGHPHGRLSSSSSQSSDSTPPSSSSSSSISAAAAAAATDLQDTVEDLARGLRQMYDVVSRAVNEEVEEALLEKSRRELAEEKLKEDEDRGIQIMRQSLGLPTNGTTNDDSSTVRPRSQSTIEIQRERAKALSEAGWQATR